MDNHSALIFVDSLAQMTLAGSNNPYQGDHAIARQYRERLVRWLTVEDAHAIFVFTSLNQFGGHKTGIPLVSEYLYRSGALPRCESEELEDKTNPSADAVGTSLWQAILASGMGARALGWPLFPWMTKSDNPGTAAGPANHELQRGMRFLDVLLKWHPRAVVVPITARAHDALSRTTQAGAVFDYSGIRKSLHEGRMATIRRPGRWADSAVREDVDRLEQRIVSWRSGHDTFLDTENTALPA